MDAREHIERLRPEIPEAFAGWRDYDFPTRIADTVTLSTFHGCPPDEIEGITKHLMTEHGLDVVVKLNPTLLGLDRVRDIVVEELGYEEIRLRPADFEADLQFDRGIALIGELQRFAAEHGRRFGVKLTNTLVVENHKGFMPDETMYLSGPPLHVVSTTLLGELDAALPGMLRVNGHDDAPIQVSFSAGITKENLPDAAALGMTPITICSDLLKPGGYGRLKPMLTGLQKAMTEAGCDDLAAWRSHRRAAAKGAGFSGAVAAYITSLHDPASNAGYTKAGNSKLPREVEHKLEMWGCVACNFCVTVCPNDAFFRLPTPEDVVIDGRQQYFVFAELCNECGNCMVFCPEDGDPAQIKPKLYLDPSRFAVATGPAFLLDGHDGDLTVTPKTGARVRGCAAHEASHRRDRGAAALNGVAARNTNADVPYRRTRSSRSRGGPRPALGCDKGGVRSSYGNARGAEPAAPARGIRPLRIGSHTAGGGRTRRWWMGS